MSNIWGAGRVGKDPVLKEVGDKDVCEMSIRMLSYRPNKDDTENPIDKGFWVQCNVWGGFAKSSARLFRKGDKIFIADGELTQDEFNSKKPDNELVRLLVVNTSMIFPWTPSVDSLVYQPRRNTGNQDKDIVATGESEKPLVST